ncbi:dihydropteroate synthase [Pedobacter westerhofensis]|uniref:dihydropteroate synthase n=1 Tax=Pedobacter westerhofensis TaxID=425512 RepID=A0A521BW26_9SPHI|nr:dihydropteroate synthase [Pedobacter westerhofensis]SMO51393.1 dihydropteroate synthase [Pedobacter westerhofensis]
MAKDTFLNRKITLNLKGELLDLSRPVVMGILNLTPDSFYSNSRISSVDLALERAENCLEEGAVFIDIGAYSSRPGADDVSTDEELRRIVPVVEAISKRFPEARLSIDTFRAKVAGESIEAGAHIINDISGGELDEQMFETVARLQVPYILMHMKGNPQTMQEDPAYNNVSLDVVDYFEQKLYTLKNLGVRDIILDPGFGFAKTTDHNYELLNHMQNLDIFGLPVLVGFSRKSMIYKFLGNTPQEALNGTTVLNTIALEKGAKILRVHDVKAAAECIALVEKLQER